MPEKKDRKLSDEVKRAIKTLKEDLEREDKEARSDLVRMWKKCENFWHGIQYIYWNEEINEWLTPNDSRVGGVNYDDEEESGPFYDYVVNIFKPHGESIISALSAQVPVVTFPPDDADDNEDIQTSKTYTKIAELLQKHNNAKLMLMEILFRFFNQGGCIAYCYMDKHKKYGTHKIPEYDTLSETSYHCPNCDGEMDDPSLMKSDAPNPDSPDVMEGAISDSSSKDLMCPSCSQLVQPEFLKSRVEEIPFVKQYIDEPKARLRIDLYGPINAKYPTYAKDQDGCGYVILKTDHHSAQLIETYPDIADEIGDHSKADGERSARSPSFSTSYEVDDQRDLMTLTRAWIRPWQLNGIKDKDLREEIKNFFPDGLKVTYCGDTFAEAVNEDMDEHIQIGKAGLSSHINADPLGKPLLANNEIRNILLNITLDTIEHAIPSTFVDAEVVNLTAYQAQQVRPGYMYPCKTKPGKSIPDAFYTEPRATLSREVVSFAQNLDQDAQFTVGDFPSIYGGPMTKNRTTATEYNKSQQAALQRLGNAWVMLITFWVKTFDTAVRLYVKSIVDDEKFSQKNTDGSYVNVWIRRSMLTGKVGNVDPDTNENFPLSSSQKQQLLMSLLQMNSEMVNVALADPSNAPLLAQALSLPDFKIPGEEQRFKQAREIQELASGEPSMGENNSLIPSVAVDTDVDDDDIHISVLKTMLADTFGLDLQKTNPKGYMNCIAHLKSHKANKDMVEQQDQMKQAQMQQAQSAKGRQ